MSPLTLHVGAKHLLLGVWQTGQPEHDLPCMHTYVHMHMYTQMQGGLVIPDAHRYTPPKELAAWWLCQERFSHQAIHPSLLTAVALLNPHLADPPARAVAHL